MYRCHELGGMCEGSNWKAKEIIVLKTHSNYLIPKDILVLIKEPQLYSKWLHSGKKQINIKIKSFSTNLTQVFSKQLMSPQFFFTVLNCIILIIPSVLVDLIIYLKNMTVSSLAVVFAILFLVDLWVICQIIFKRFCFYISPLLYSLSKHMTLRSCPY